MIDTVSKNDHIHKSSKTTHCANANRKITMKQHSNFNNQRIYECIYMNENTNDIKIHPFINQNTSRLFLSKIIFCAIETSTK